VVDLSIANAGSLTPKASLSLTGMHLYEGKTLKSALLIKKSGLAESFLKKSSIFYDENCLEAGWAAG